MKRIIGFFLVVLYITILAIPALAKETEDEQNSNYITTKIDSGYGQTQIKLKTGFDFTYYRSIGCDWDLSLTALALSNKVYEDGDAQNLLTKLGYDKAWYAYHDGLSGDHHPTSCFGYKHFVDDEGNEKNIFAAAIRGTNGWVDIVGTDVVDGVNFFRQSALNVKADFEAFIEEATGKKINQISKEDNYFFLTGHSMGGAIANQLSANPFILELANNNKNKIYTFTFESPRTCTNDWHLTTDNAFSNAFNFKNNDDCVVHLPPNYWGTTYGRTMLFTVDKLDNSIFMALFPNANGGSVTEAPKTKYYQGTTGFGHHDIGLDLVYILQSGIHQGKWKNVNEVAGSTTDVLNIETGEFCEEMVSENQAMSWKEFVSQYHDVVDWLGVGGDYTDKMHIAIFELRNEKGDVLKRQAMFNPSGFGYDPFGWGINSNNSYSLPSEPFEKGYFYIRYKDVLAVGPAVGERFTEVLKDGSTLLALDGLWSDGFNTLTISNSTAQSLEFMPYFTRLWSSEKNIYASTSGRNGIYEFDNREGFAGTISLEGDTLVLTVLPGSHIVADKTKTQTFRFSKVDDIWKSAYKEFLSSGEYKKTADFYDDQDIMLLLIDMTADNIPELVITSGGNGLATRGGYIFGYENGEVKFRSTLATGLFSYSMQNDIVYFTISDLTGAQAEEPQYNSVVYIDWLKSEGYQIIRKRAKVEKSLPDGYLKSEFFVSADADNMYDLIQLALEETYHSGKFKPQMLQNVYSTLQDALAGWDTFVCSGLY